MLAIVIATLHDYGELIGFLASIASPWLAIRRLNSRLTRLERACPRLVTLPVEMKGSTR